MTSRQAAITPQSNSSEPLRIAAVVTTALRLYAADVLPFWWMTAGRIVPVEVAIVLMRQIFVPSRSRFTHAHIGVPPGSGLAFTITSFASVALAYLVFIASVAALCNRLTGASRCGRADLSRQQLTPGEWRSLLWVTFLATLGVASATVCVAVPGIYLAVCFSIAIPVFLMEGRRGLACLVRCSKLVRRSWWRTLATLSLAAAVAGLLRITVALISTPIISGVHSITSFLILSAAINTLVIVLCSPLCAAVVTVLYDELLRREHDRHLPPVPRLNS